MKVVIFAFRLPLHSFVNLIPKSLFTTTKHVGDMSLDHGRSAFLLIFDSKFLILVRNWSPQLGSFSFQHYEHQLITYYILYLLTKFYLYLLFFLAYSSLLQRTTTQTIDMLQKGGCTTTSLLNLFVTDLSSFYVTIKQVIFFDQKLWPTRDWS